MHGEGTGSHSVTFSTIPAFLTVEQTVIDRNIFLPHFCHQLKNTFLCTWKMLADKTYSAVRNNLTVVKNIYFRTEWHTHAIPL